MSAARAQHPRIFLLSPASCSGKRAQLLLRSEANFDLASRIRRDGASLADVFAFLSGLYFRGKVAYVARFALPPAGVAGAYCITTSRGLLPLDAVLTVGDLCTFDAVHIDASNPTYARPLNETALALADRLPANTEVVLLGSVATRKYASVLLPIFGKRLRYPKSFAGLGDMSRGSLMLRAVRDERELEYVALDAGAAPRAGTKSQSPTRRRRTPLTSRLRTTLAPATTSAARRRSDTPAD